jgi:hypothetical protein
MPRLSISSRISLPVATLVTALLAACSSTQTDTATGPVNEKALESAPFLGVWRSELDGAMLTLEPTGMFSVEIPAKGNAPARGAVGTWTFDGTDAVFTNLHASASCPDEPGAYRVELMRDTLRFTKVRDTCAPREEHMAWPWTRRK